MAVPSKMYLTLLVSFVLVVHCLEIIPEHAGISYFNKKYISQATFKVFRYSRKSPYYVEVVGTILHTWGNNITAQLIFYENFGNTYKRSFVDIKMRLCDLFKDSILTTLLSETGYSCPVPPGAKYLRNMSLYKTSKNFASVKWPFKKAKLEVILTKTDTNELIASGSVVVNFVQ